MLDYFVLPKSTTVTTFIIREECVRVICNWKMMEVYGTEEHVWISHRESELSPVHFNVRFPSRHTSVHVVNAPWQCSMSIHAGFEVLILLLDLLQALIQLHIFVFLERKKIEDLSIYYFFCSIACLDAQQLFSSATVLTSLSSSISFFSCWWSCLFLISRTTLRLSSSCSRYRVCESFCRDECQDGQGLGKSSIMTTASFIQIT